MADLEALPQRLEKDDGGGGRDVKGVGLAAHGDAHLGGFGGEPEIGEAVLFAAEEQGGGSGEGGVPVCAGGGGCCGDRGDAALAQPEASLIVAAEGTGHGEDGSLRSADGVRVAGVGDGAGEENGVDPGGIGGAEESAQVAGFFDGFDEKDQGRRAKGPQSAKGKLRQAGQTKDAVGAFAVGEPGEGGVGDGGEGKRGKLGGELAQAGSGGVREEDLERAHARSDGAGEFALALNEEVALLAAVGAVAQTGEGLDAGIARAGDAVGHGVADEATLR